jgi:hypothetical protein
LGGGGSLGRKSNNVPTAVVVDASGEGGGSGMGLLRGLEIGRRGKLGKKKQ